MLNINLNSLFIICLFIYNSDVLGAHAHDKRLPQSVFKTVPKRNPDGSFYTKVYFIVNNDQSDHFCAKYITFSNKMMKCVDCTYYSKYKNAILSHLKSGVCNPEYAGPRASSF